MYKNTHVGGGEDVTRQQLVYKAEDAHTTARWTPPALAFRGSMHTSQTTPPDDTHAAGFGCWLSGVETRPARVDAHTPKPNRAATNSAQLASLNEALANTTTPAMPVVHFMSLQKKLHCSVCRMLVWTGSATCCRSSVMGPRPVSALARKQPMNDTLCFERHMCEHRRREAVRSKGNRSQMIRQTGQEGGNRAATHVRVC
jgi:hypothetical protein